MTNASESILAKICRLPVVERIDVACAIWEGLIYENVPIELTAEQMMELDRRLANRNANPTQKRTWEEFKTEQLRKFK